MLKPRALILLSLLCFAAQAQPIRVELDFEQETYLPLEELRAFVKVYNSSGQTLSLGDDEAWLSFTLEAADGSLVKQVGMPDVAGEFTLPSAHRAKKSVDLSKAFDLSRLGRYNAVATVKIPAWGESFSSKAKPFTISPGVKLWEQAFGIPGEKEGERPEIRKYQVVQANHLKHLSLYLRITDENEAFTYKIFPIGPIIAFSKPEAQLDTYSNLHLLYQDYAKRFSYTMITPDGLMLLRQTFDIVEGSRPALRVNNEGKISVSGGARRVSASDLPPPDLLSDTLQAERPAPQTTLSNAPKEGN